MFMIKLFIILISMSAFAESYVVTHRGHTYNIHFDKSGVNFKSKKFKFDIPLKDCSKYIIEDIQESFKSSIRKRITNIDKAISVKSEKETFYVSPASKEGKQLIFFPDKVAKGQLIYNEACK